MKSVMFAAKDHHAGWKQQDFEDLAKGEGEVYEAPIEHLIDMNMLVKCPFEMVEWLNEHAILLWDVGSTSDIGFENGKVFVKRLNSDEWLELTEALVKQVMDEK